MAEKRQGISKGLRFEVFKRDGFTCQYCGRKSPDVILEVDHINPVKNGGKNNILNLITSCKDCNRGKGAKLLSNNQTLERQRKQLEELNERRQQLKMMLEWKTELDNFENEQADVIDNLISENTGRCLSDVGRENVKKYIKKYGFEEVMEVTKISLKQYFKGTTESAGQVIDYIPKICAVRKRQKDDPWEYKRYYIKGILRNRMTIYNDKRLAIMLKNIVTDKETYETISDFAKYSDNWTVFWESVNELFEGDW